jgi:MFS family permease
MEMKLPSFNSYRGLSQDAKYLIYQSILPAVAFGMFYTDVAYFLTTVQGLPYDFMGAVVTTMGISTFVAAVPLGLLADRYGRKKMLVVGNVIAAAIIAAFAFTTNPLALLTAAVFEGISEAAFSASSGALLAENAEDAKRNSVFSLYGFAQSISYGIGSLVIPAVTIFELLGFSNQLSHAILYVTVAAFSLASTGLLVRVKDRPKKVKKPKQKTPMALHSASRRNLAKYALTGAIVAFGAGMVVPLMSAWMSKQYGISDAVSGPILGIASLVIGIATLASPILAEKLGLVRAIVVTQAASTVFMFATPLSASFVIASTVYTVRAFLMNMASPLSQSMIMGLVEEDERGVASGINSALWRLPNALSTYIGAYLLGIGFLATPFFLASLLYVISIGLFWSFFRKIRMPEELHSKSLPEPLVQDGEAKIK